MLEQGEYAGIDTSYISVPKHDKMIYLGAYGFYQYHALHLPDRPNHMFTTRQHVTQEELEVGIDWRGLSIELPIPIVNSYTSSYGLAKNGSVWGARIRYKATDHMTGTIEEGAMSLPEPETIKDIERGQFDLKTFYVEGYYVFNHSRFCLAAGLYGDMIQRKSAGGFFVMANYYQSRLGCNQMFDHYRDTFRNNKFSVGGGYGYNLSFSEGRLCLHASLIPMLSVVNRLTHKYYDEENGDYREGSEVRNSRFTLNGFARLAASYSINDKLLLNAFFNFRQYMFSNSSDLRITHQDADLQINLGYRF